MTDEAYEPRHRGTPRVEGSRRGTGPVLPGLLVAFTLVAFVVLRDPGAAVNRFVDTGRGGSADSFAFVKTDRGGEPVGWDPCRPIHYVVNPEQAPAGWERTVDSAIRTIQRGSSFRFVDDGTTTSREFEGRTENNVLIAWADPDEVPKLAGDTVGIGGAQPQRRAGRVTYVSGVVVLDVEEYADMERSGRVPAQALILAHELGHVLGLDHVEDTDQLMNASYIGQRDLGAGDIRGLEILHALPCSDE